MGARLKKNEGVVGVLARFVSPAPDDVLVKRLCGVRFIVNEPLEILIMPSGSDVFI